MDIPARRMRAWFFIGVICTAPAMAVETLSFNEHIRPILADNCFACHGTDAAHRKAKLRLDTAEGATTERNDVTAIVPGNLQNSELWHRIISKDDDEVMPPPDSHKTPLKPEQIALIKAWIEQGAVYQKHWAYEAVTRPPLPTTKGDEERHPIDQFIRTKLATKKLSLAKEAAPETLLRRVTLDLTGLPPTPEELDAFLSDKQPAAYERAVDRLLASPRYGEHFGRHWLDAVRYADTHGLHLDNVRQIWPYRDWVVAAFNRNLPYNQFTVEQLAGDMLPEARIDQVVASGYNRNHLSTSEGGAIEAEAQMRNTADRADTTAALWMGMTTNCASCHDHKFDPLTQKEYYSLGAIFKGLADRPWDGNVRVSAPIAVIADTPEKQQRIAEINRAIKPLEAALSARADEIVAAGTPIMKLEKTPITYDVVWADDSDLPTLASVMTARPPGEWQSGSQVPLASGTRALRLDGDVPREIAFTTGDLTLTVQGEVKVFVDFHPDAAKPPRAISLEFISAEKTKRVIWGDKDAFGPEIAATALHAGTLPTVNGYTRLEIVASASGVEKGKKYTGVRLAQSDGGAWWDRIGATITSPSAIDDPLLSKDAWARSLRGSARGLEAVPIRHDLNFVLGLSGTQQNEEEKKRIPEWHRNYVYGPLRGALEPQVHAVRRLLTEQIHYESTFPVTVVSGERDEPLPAHVMLRGQYDKPGELVQAGTPAFLPPIEPTNGRVTRLDFARWLASPRHPLTSRVTVNRFWLQLFGAGIVRTPVDFGVQGDAPTHPELLDWIASEFMQSGWDVKKLVRLMVTSRTYRQDAYASPGLLELDPENKLLARGPRLRLDAEVLRDQALAFGGLLRPEIGGPPARPYQPINVWEPVAFGGSNTKTYVQDHGDALYRRSLYSFWKRTAPAPSMATFDAPSRETFCVARGRSNTPLQALALMNDVQHFEAARAFAERLLTRSSSSETERLAYAFRCVTARTPNKHESELLAESLARHRKHFETNAEAASEVIANGESKPLVKLPAQEFAAWTMVANLLMNLDETITRN